jgi:hypothetical protein
LEKAMMDYAQMEAMYKIPPMVNGPEQAFGIRMKKIPPFHLIPAEFKSQHNRYNQLASKWFFCGLTQDDIPLARAGTDRDGALRFLGALLRSLDPKHEHKEAAAAWLMSLWFTEPEEKQCRQR